MNWRTDKPTADVIVAFIGRAYPRVLVRDKRYNTDVLYNDTYGVQFTEDEIEKWAGLEEDEGTICPQKQRGRPNKVYEYPVEVPNNDGCLAFIYMTNSTIRKKLRLKKGERAIISIRKEI